MTFLVVIGLHLFPLHCPYFYGSGVFATAHLCNIESFCTCIVLLFCKHYKSIQTYLGIAKHKMCSKSNVCININEGRNWLFRSDITEYSPWYCLLKKIMQPELVNIQISVTQAVRKETKQEYQKYMVLVYQH